MRLLFIGDIVGSPGRNLIKDILPGIKKQEDIDVCIANAENAAGGSGITSKVADELFLSGVDVITSGDHVWRNKEIYNVINRSDRLLRPANFPHATPGQPSCIVSTKNGVKVGVINVLGRIFMKPILDCPFKAVREQIERIKQETPIIFVDIHAEATSEKVAMGWFLDGKVSAVVGTHTHIPTADERILPNGTAYLTDVGMVGSQKSVLGRDIEPVLKHFTTSLPSRFTVATEHVVIQSVVIDIDNKSGKAHSIKRMERSNE